MHGNWWNSSHAANYKNLDQKFYYLPNFPERENIIDSKYSQKARSKSTEQIKEWEARKIGESEGGRGLLLIQTVLKRKPE